MWGTDLLFTPKGQRGRKSNLNYSNQVQEDLDVFPSVDFISSHLLP